MHKRMHPEQKIINYIDVKSVVEYSSKVEKIGGSVVIPRNGSTLVIGSFCILPRYRKQQFRYMGI